MSYDSIRDHLPPPSNHIFAAAAFDPPIGYAACTMANRSGKPYPFSMRAQLANPSLAASLVLAVDGPSWQGVCLTTPNAFSATTYEHRPPSTIPVDACVEHVSEELTPSIGLLPPLSCLATERNDTETWYERATDDAQPYTEVTRSLHSEAVTNADPGFVLPEAAQSVHSGSSNSSSGGKTKPHKSSPCGGKTKPVLFVCAPFSGSDASTIGAAQNVASQAPPAIIEAGSSSNGVCDTARADCSKEKTPRKNKPSKEVAWLLQQAEKESMLLKSNKRLRSDSSPHRNQLKRHKTGTNKNNAHRSSPTGTKPSQGKTAKKWKDMLLGQCVKHPQRSRGKGCRACGVAAPSP